MNVFYEEDGGFKVATILADNDTSLQVEAPHGKRSKIKATAVLLRFAAPAATGFIEAAQQQAGEFDPNFLWECCTADAEFSYETLAQDYFGHAPSPLEAAAVLMRLHDAPMYFYKKGRGRYKAAPPESLKAALASVEKKRRLAEQQAEFVAQLSAFTLPDEFSALLPDLLYAPDKNTLAWKALEAAAAITHLSATHLLEKCGAIPSTHDYHFDRFVRDHFTQAELAQAEFADWQPGGVEDLPLASVEAFSIDDATTTEIDDAFSLVSSSNGGFRIGIHIAAPALGILPGSLLDKAAAKRLSTVYLPGNKITMLPESAIHHYTLGEERLCPVLSMYLDVADDYTVTATESRVEQIRIAANLRHDTLEEHFNEYTLAQDTLHHPFGKELRLLWNFAVKMEALRGKASDSNNDKVDYNFHITADRVSITERRRGSPIDKLVSELMIYVNSQWGKQLADAGVAGIYRSQSSGNKVRMSTSPAPHQGLGVAQYAWASSPLRRYVDLINQRQIIALVHKTTPPYTRNADALLLPMRDFEIAYDAYNEFQRGMERYWCLRWLLQENISTLGAEVIKENLVKLDKLPLLTRVVSLPELAPGTQVELAIDKIDLLEMSFHAQFVRRMSEAEA